MVNTASPAPSQERRRGRRYPAAKLHARLRVKKGLFGDWVDVTPRDYNRLGIAIDTDQPLSADQSIMLQITLSVDMGDIVIDKVEGMIRNAQPKGSCTRYGVEFDFDASRHMRSEDTQKQLAKIEEILVRSESLTQRMTDQTMGR
ncbi:MAG: PilZ domain-containing protein [Hahellaceae bacterium]|nr:PilZ domain-containing protein [Hahellaceae bacterium]MCP5168399.1 PilZ domain-containing protein [Hahellaceae bacterium]